MKPLLPLFVTCGVAVLGCSGPPSPLLDEESSASALMRLQKDTGHSWSIRWQADLPTAAFLQGRTPPLALTPTAAEAAARAFIIRYEALFGLTSDDTLAPDSTAADELGMIHTSFLQRRGAVPVWGAQLRAHFAADGALVRLNGRSLPIPNLSLVPTRSAAEATTSALLDARALRPELATSSFSELEPSLWILPTSDGARLAWRVEIDVHDGTQPMMLESFVDADDASILQRHDILTTLMGSGTGVLGDRQSLTISEKDDEYWLQDPSRGSSPAQQTYSDSGGSHLPGTGVHSDDPQRWDLAGDAAGAAVDAHAFVARSWDYFLDVHGRAGWDGQGHGVRATVHFGDHFAAAFFDGQQLVFGDGNADLSPMAGALDVVAHELVHGVTLTTAQLDPNGESGALNEAISDLFACLISRGAVTGGDWQIGGSIYHPAGRPRAIRDLARPHESGNPETLAEYVVTTGDSGGVHINSTIVSHAAYLMAEGAPGIPALGPDATGRIWYRALSRYLTSQARFADAADETVAAATDFGLGEEVAVRAAWVAAGVLSE